MNILLKPYKVKCIITAIDIEFIAFIKQFKIKHEHIFRVNDEYIIAECIDRRIVVAKRGLER